MRPPWRRSVALSVALAGLAAPAAAAAHWSAARIVAPAGGAAPALAVDGRGDAVLAASSPAPGGTLNVARIGSGGQAGSIEALGGVGAFAPHVAASPAGDLVSWAERTSTGSVFAVSPTASRPFGAPQPIAAPIGGQADTGGVAVDAAGRGLVVWVVTAGDGTTRVLAAWHARGARGLGRPQTLFTGGGTAGGPVAAVTGGDRFLVAFAGRPPRSTGDASERVFVTGAPAGRRFPRPTALTPAALTAQPPLVLATDSRTRRAVVAWATTDPARGDTTVQLKALVADARGRFGPARRVGTITPGQPPDLAAAISPAGDAIVVVAGAGDHDLHGALARGGRGFGPGTTFVDLPTGSLLNPAAAFDSHGTGVIAWSQTHATEYPEIRHRTVEAKLLPVGARRFCPAHEVARGDVGFPLLGADLRGGVLLAFVDGGASALELARHTPGPGRPGSCAGA